MRSVLVDTSVWVQHFRRPNHALAHLLDADVVLSHPMVIGEIACGTPPDRANTLSGLGRLQCARVATLQEAVAFLEREKLFGTGCGLIDLLLLASVLITPNTDLWTLDQRLDSLSVRFGASFNSRLH